VSRRVAWATLVLALVVSCGSGTPIPSPSDQGAASRTAAEPVTPSVVLTESVTGPPPSPAATVESTPEGLLRLTNDPARDDAPAWSSDGSRLAFYSDRSGVDEIFVMNPDRSGLAQLTDDPRIRFKEDPAWSPDDRRIAFSALDDVNRILTFEVRAAEVRPYEVPTFLEGHRDLISDYYVDAYHPDWSPDGGTIAMVMNDTGNERQVFTVDPSTGEFFQVTRGPAPTYWPSWSPDGRTIAFASSADGDLEIYLIGVKGDNLVRLTDNSVLDGKPSWSLDGRFILFSSDRDGPTGLYVMRLDGSDVRPLHTGPGEAFTPAWSPDGRYIAFVSNRDGNFEIYRIDAPNLEP